MSEYGTQVGIARIRAGTIEPAVRQALASVMDPELPMVSIVDMGMVGEVRIGDAIRVDVLPTYVGCPAVELIRSSVEARLAVFGRPVEVRPSFADPVDIGSDHADRARGPAIGRDRGAGHTRGHSMSVLRVGSSRPRQRLRADPMPLAVLLPRVSAAVRSDQARLIVDPVIGVVGIVGAGTMGAGIAQVALEAGHVVHLQDVDPAALAAAETRIRDGLARRQSSPAQTADRLQLMVSIDDLADADLVIEAAIEDLAVKRSIFEALERVVAPEAILATNTSALSVASIAAATDRPQRVAGLHFFNPAPVMRLVEVVTTPMTAPLVATRLTRLMTGWGRTPVRASDTPGFIVNRVNRPFTLEALAAVERGEGDPDGIDAAVRSHGYPMGPFELMDLIGLDVNLAVARALFDAANAAGDPIADRFRPSAAAGTARRGREARSQARRRVLRVRRGWAANHTEPRRGPRR